jgi:hypothetical protein
MVPGQQRQNRINAPDSLVNLSEQLIMSIEIRISVVFYFQIT